MLHLELDVAGSGMAFHPGDSVGLLPENADALVDALIKRLGLQPSAVFAVEPAEGGGENGSGGALLPHLRWPCTVRAALKVRLGPAVWDHTNEAHDAGPSCQRACLLQCCHGISWIMRLLVPLQRGCDLTSAPRKSLLRLLAEHCSDDKERYRMMLLCSRDGREAYQKVRLGSGRALVEHLH